MATGRNQKLGLVVGPIFVLGALLFGGPNTTARFDYAGAPRVEATVLVADYDHTARGTIARIITVAAPDPVPVDDLRSAPRDLVPGTTVTVLTRPGHALLPSQLRWSVLAVPALALLAELVITWVGVEALRDDPPSGPTDPEAWF
ncbi:hypothetical protein BX265_8307 [Streptomyces sp. TLI_235]|nr:hypothetical protein [Streptomyces sp. TLI_235]PBC67677.1 hypothetical protein BX265_8307 [Streptomyces sp. TLI_235]